MVDVNRECVAMVDALYYSFWSLEAEILSMILSIFSSMLSSDRHQSLR
jgi:hypothetical protein